MRDQKKVTPMDDGIRERSVGEARPNNQRQCWAIKTLVVETHTLFPETPVEYGDYDGRNTALSVTFDCSMLDETEQVLFTDLLRILDTDERVKDTEVGSDQVYVLMHSNPRTQDSREPFGLDDALSILSDDEDADDDTGWGAIGWQTPPEQTYDLFGPFPGGSQ